MLVSSMSAVSAASDAGVEPRQAPSCGEWVSHREKSNPLALGNTSWLVGYLSGLAVSRGTDFLAGTDNASLYRWMDNYCRTNPLRDVGSGGAALAAELGRKQAAPK